MSIPKPMDKAIVADARVLWSYHRLDMPLDGADVLVGLGSYDISVAEHASQLFLEGRAPWLMFSGGLVSRDDLLRSPWAAAEAEVFKAIAIAQGVPQDRILVESRSRNTGENLRFSLGELSRLGIECSTVIVVTKPNMERRVRATGRRVFPRGFGFAVTSSPCSFNEYCFERFDPHTIINLMVGDLQRVREYPKLGFQEPELIPECVQEAYERLVAAGYTRHLLP